MKAKAQRRRGKPLWRPLKTWHPHEWVPFKEAWQRVEAAVGGALWLTQRDLRQAFLDKRLVAAVRRIAADGTETRIVLEPAFWQPVKINYAWSITGWQAEAREGEAWVFVVRRRELDKHYPAADAVPSEQRADDLQPRRKPGPKANWRLPAAAEMHRIRKEEQKNPTAGELCEFCDKTLNHYPDEREMRRLMRYLLAE
jgi:hypothetical protein